MKARREYTCGRCRRLIGIGDAVSTRFGVPWHAACVVSYLSQRHSLAASAGR